jgi:hypothetical protein
MTIWSLLGIDRTVRCTQSTVYSVETLTGTKIHNFDLGDFCKKSRNRSIFVFPCPHFDAYGFCISTPGSAQPPLTTWQRIQRTICLLNIFKAYVLKNKKKNATNFQNGHRLFFGQLKIHSNMHSLRFITFPV